MFQNSPNSQARRFGGIVAIGGGISGIGTLAATLIHVDGIVTYLLGAVLIALFVFGTWIGIKLLEGSAHAVRPFALYLALQLPIVQSNLVSYFFASLASLSVVWRGGSEFDVIVAPIGGATLSLFTPQPKSGVGLNIFPFLVAMLFGFLNRRPRGTVQA